MLLCAALAACGGGGDDAPASQSPTNTGAQNGGGTTNSGQTGTGVVAGGGGASSNGDTPTTTGSTTPSTPSTPTSDASLVGVASAKGATTLSWMPPTMNDDGTPAKLTGFRIYWGETEGNYSHSVTLDNPGLTRYVVDQLSPATWYFMATALSSDGESPPSNVVVMRVL